MECSYYEMRGLLSPPAHFLEGIRNQVWHWLVFLGLVGFHSPTRLFGMVCSLHSTSFICLGDVPTADFHLDHGGGENYKQAANDLWH